MADKTPSVAEPTAAIATLVNTNARLMAQHADLMARLSYMHLNLA